MTTAWHVPEDDALSTVAVARALGDGSLVLADGSKFGAAGWPKLVVVRRGVPPNDTLVTILEFTGRSGNTLTGVTPGAGYSDAAIHINDIAFLGPTKQHIIELQNTVDAIRGLPSGVTWDSGTTTLKVGGATPGLRAEIDPGHGTEVRVASGGASRTANLGVLGGTSYSISGPTSGPIIVPRNTLWETQQWSWTFWLKLAIGTSVTLPNMLGTAAGAGGATAAGICNELYTSVLYLNILNTQRGIVGNDSIWRLISYTMDDSSLLIYTDSHLAYTYIPGAMVWGTGDLTIGTFGNPLLRMKDFRIYNRKLSLADVQTLYSGAELPLGLVANWRMNEGSGHTITDSVSGLVGTATGTINWSTDVPTQHPGEPLSVTQPCLVWQGTVGQVTGERGTITFGDPAGRLVLGGALNLAPTAAHGTNNSQVATTAFVQDAITGSTGGTVTSVSVVTANGVSGSVSTATTTPAITVTLGAITPSSVAATGNVTGANISGTNTGNQTITLTGDVTGTGTGSFTTTIGATRVTNAMLAGSITAAKLVGSDITIAESQVTGLTTDIASKANLASPTLTGTPLAPTASNGTNTTQIATTAFVLANVGSGAVSSVFTRTGAIVASSGDYTVSQITGAAPLASPALTGTPTFAGSTSGTTSLKASATASGTLTLPAATDILATQTYVTSQGYLTANQTITLTGDVTGTGTGSFATTIGAARVTNSMLSGSIAASKLVGSDITIAESQVTNLTTDLASKAPLASPTFTGTVTVGTLSGMTKATTGALSTATEGTDYLSGASNKLPIPFSFSGTGIPTIANDVCPWHFVGFAATATHLVLSCRVSPSGDFQVTIKRSSDSGSTFPDTIGTVTVTSGGMMAVTTVFTNAILAAGDVLRIDINSVNGAANWTARLLILSRNQ